jgi:tRNA-2-methylthio-N6-dimethylallyladenosine synthase
MKYHIITYGCQMNKSDSERIASVLEDCGCKEASKINEADLIVVNMCSVRQSAVDRVFGLAQKFSKLKIKNKKLKIILTGCILKEDRKKFEKKFDLILNIKDLPNWPRIFGKETNDLIQPWQNHRLSCDYLNIQPKYQNKSLAFIPISNGCNNFCSYCVVPFVRGPLVCRDYKKILAEVKNVIKRGVKEIWLLGQNVNCYRVKSKIKNQKSKIINFAKLIEMINAIPGDFKFFFTSPHPKNFSDELIETLAKCEKFGKYLNLPVQSGDNEILKRMNRNYTIEEYKSLVKKIRKKIPNIKLSTDVIVGFPGETEKQFQNTVKLFKEIKFDWAYIAKYSPRIGTVAFQFKDDVPLLEKKYREKTLRNILRSQTRQKISCVNARKQMKKKRELLKRNKNN